MPVFIFSSQNNHSNIFWNVIKNAIFWNDEEFSFWVWDRDKKRKYIYNKYFANRLKLFDQ